MQRTVLYDRELVTVRHVACCVTDSAPSGVESPERDGIVLPLRGVFMQHTAPSRRMLADPNHALFFAEGVSQRISHPVTDRDECLDVDLAPDVLRDVLVGEAGAERLAELGTHALLPAGATAARSLLWRRLQRGVAGALEVEETCIDLVRTAIRAARRKSGSIPPLRDDVNAVRTTLLERPEQKWTLSALARRAATSPYHLARMFRAETGVSIHHYQIRARIARAIDSLLDTDQEMSGIAHDLGFASHSHFTSVFRRFVGVVPSEFRSRATTRDAAATRTLLTASLPM